MQGPAVSAGRFVALRLLPGDDLVVGLRAGFDAAGVRAMAVGTCVGSLSRVRLRHAGQADDTAHDGTFEIVSLTGTIDPDWQHLHIAISDPRGRVLGGHLAPQGAVVRTTAEIVLIALADLAFARAPCAVSGYRELTIARDQT